MTTQQIAIGKLKPNPFKKYINKGKFNEEIIEKLKESISHKTLPLVFNVRQRDSNYELCFGHHRIEALKRVYGNDFKVTINIVDYDDETMLIDMVRENITHREVDYQDKKESITLSYNWLGSKCQSVKRFDTLNIKKGFKGFQPVEDSYRSVAFFLSKNGKTISYETVRNYLQTLNLDEEIDEKIGKTKNGADKKSSKKSNETKSEKKSSKPKKEKDEEKYPVWYAFTLSRFKDKSEQRDLFKVLENSKEQRRNQMNKLINAYKVLPDDLKQFIRKLKIDITYAPIFKKVIDEVEDKVNQAKIIDRIKKNGLNDEQINDLIKKNTNNPNFKPLKDQLPKDLIKEDWWLPEDKRPQGYGRNDFHGNCSPLLIKQGLLRYAKNRNAIILDSMSGSGTFLDVAKEMGYKKINVFDIYPIREDIKKGYAQNTGLKLNSVDFIFNHYPYWEMVDYSKYSNKRDKKDLSNMAYKDFLDNVQEIVKHNFSILKKGGFYMVLVGDIRRQGRKFLASEIYQIATKIGFNLWDRAVMRLSSQVIKADTKAFYRALKNNYMVQTFDDILVFKKV